MTGAKANRGKLKWEIRGLNDGGTTPDTFGSHSGVGSGFVLLKMILDLLLDLLNNQQAALLTLADTRI